MTAGPVTTGADPREGFLERSPSREPVELAWAVEALEFVCAGVFECQPRAVHEIQHRRGHEDLA